jgi:hypothetical protein
MPNSNAVAPPRQPQMTVQQANNAAQRLVVQNAVEMTQNIYSGSIFPTSQPILNIIPRNVGLIKRFVIRVQITLENTGAVVANLSPNGLANILKNVTFYDLQNNLRINTNGIHLNALSSVKRRRPFGGCADFNQIQSVPGPAASTLASVSQMFNVPPATNPVFVAPATIAAGATVTAIAFFEIPIAYSDDDLRGGIFANVVNTTMNLQLTLNADKAFNGVTAGADDTFSIYSGSTGLMTAAAIDIYQVYLDQLPTNAQDGSFILPQISLATVYELKNTMFTAISPNQDFPVPFTNFRDFFSTFAIFNADGTSSGKEYFNINYWSLTTANFTNVWKYTADYANLLAREVLSADLPQGMYYFSFRKHPIWTTQYGNQQVNLNASVATPASYMQIMWEDMALQNTLVGSASLPAAGM